MVVVHVVELFHGRLTEVYEILLSVCLDCLSVCHKAVFY